MLVRADRAGQVVTRQVPRVDQVVSEQLQRVIPAGEVAEALVRLMSA